MRGGVIIYYQRLKDLREDKDKDQTEIADIIKMSTRQYGLYERGKTDIPLEKALLLAEYYDVSLDYIAGRTNYKKGLNKSNLTTDETNILNKYHTLSDVRKAKITERLEMLCEEQQQENRKQKGVV